MSNRSEAIKKWKTNFKEIVIEAMGGSCVMCNYNTCKSSLILHHIDPNQKDFRLGDIVPSSKNWGNIVAELKKCALLCANCHSELHAGFSTLPQLYARFNEYFADYESLSKLLSKEDIQCACGKPKTLKAEYCSNTCLFKNLTPIDWDSIDLIKELETRSYSDVARQLNCHPNTVKRKQTLLLKKIIHE
jgi:hypothetical protein